MWMGYWANRDYYSNASSIENAVFIIYNILIICNKGGGRRVDKEPHADNSRGMSPTFIV